MDSDYEDKTKNQIVSFRASYAFVEDLDALAGDDDRTRSWTAHRACELGLRAMREDSETVDGPVGPGPDGEA